ncbi:hypothetical protein PGT21_018252 [Puccinia graminis f. sp. tritici]|uniref:Uncharacterized protein n=1 Tax=Puccinia graminis f. sp. tritici TaxID=56615 RepID=A0A5B0NNC4_PUCGR|nr:hypothetical protein PGT21_018252 [Puccinia graminis f. sp. tritici]
MFLNHWLWAVHHLITESSLRYAELKRRVYDDIPQRFDNPEKAPRLLWCSTLFEKLSPRIYNEASPSPSPPPATLEDPNSWSPQTPLFKLTSS